MPRHQFAQYLPSNTFALLRASSVAPCGLIPRMYLCTVVDSARDVGNDQWAIIVPFDCFFYVSFGFL